ncbi:hypothetical protein [Aporhodopirellula aestuarii]|uniref:Uncharacterized protein n=1 Tax=Aporhodopirellula aestuarii TaxID=2950107 RepID=A0ABT0U917_9BACT|nr:hypothetical protein [Aporhodopirellula aestuarii]MCM2373383.1 hypothetical protein [Aporhodopirellula aestuarii]
MNESTGHPQPDATQNSISTEPPSVDSETRDDVVFESPRSIAPVAQLSTRGLFLALAAVCLFPLITLSAYAIIFGKASEHQLPVNVIVDRRPLPTFDGEKQILEDVVVIENEADFAIPNVTVNLNGQYFLYQDKPLEIGETLVVRQAAFATKSSQRWVPGRYRLTDITVTGKLPSGARGVTEVQY